MRMMNSPYFFELFLSIWGVILVRMVLHGTSAGQNKYIRVASGEVGNHQKH